MSLRSDALGIKNATGSSSVTQTDVGTALENIADVAETVDTIADLKNYADAQAGDIVQVRSYHAGVDGGGGKFRAINKVDIVHTSGSSRTADGSEDFITVDVKTAYGAGAIFRFSSGALVQFDSARGAVGDTGDIVSAYVLSGTIQPGEEGYIYRPYDTRNFDDGNMPFLDLPEGMMVESDVLEFPLRWERILEGEKEIKMWGAIPNANWDSVGNDASKAFQAAQLEGGKVYVRPSNTGNYYNIDNPVEINKSGITFEFEAYEDVNYNENNEQEPSGALLYTNNATQNFFNFFPNAPNQYRMSNFTFNGSITTYGVTNYTGRVFNYVLSAGMRYHQYNLFYSGNYDYMSNTATFGDGGTVWYVDYYNTSTVNGFLSRATFDGNLVAYGRGLYVSDNPTPEQGNFSNGFWVYFDSDNGHQAVKFVDGGGLSFISSIFQTRSNLPQSDKDLEPMFDLDAYGLLVDVQIWDVRSNTTGRTTPQRGVKFYNTDIPSRAVNRTIINDGFGLVEGLEYTTQNSYLRNPSFTIPMNRRQDEAYLSHMHNTFIGIDLKDTDGFKANHYNATGYDLEANLTDSEGVLPASNGITIDQNEFLCLCRHPGENISGEPTFSQVRADVNYSSSVDVDNDFLEIIYKVDALGTVSINRVDVKFITSGHSCKKVQVIGIQTDGTTSTGSKTIDIVDPTAALNEFITVTTELGDPQGYVIVRLIGYGDAGGGSIEIDDIAGYMTRLENDNMALMPRTGGPMWNDVVFDKNGTGPVIESPDGTKYRITVDNAGALSATAV